MDPQEKALFESLEAQFSSSQEGESTEARTPKRWIWWPLQGLLILAQVIALELVWVGLCWFVNGGIRGHW